MIDFCTTHQLFISNSRFKHPARHITTWQNTRERNSTNINIFNQIDYIICPMSKKHCLIDARSFQNTLVDSDHRLVEFHKLYRQKTSNSNKKYNYLALVNNIEKQKEYRTLLEAKINPIWK